jgi:hypothetical protein
MPLTPDEFRAKYPLIIEWIGQTLASHSACAHTVASRNFSRLPSYFSRGLLESAKVVATDRLPVPPLSQLGLPQFGEWERGEYAGITYLDTFFVIRDQVTNESLHFHELVHVVQWQLLGPERFVAMYAAGLEQFGYRDSPLEAAAYDLEDRFRSTLTIFDAEKAIAARLAG